MVQEVSVESFIRYVTPIVIALFGLAVFFLIGKTVFDRRDTEGDDKNNEDGQNNSKIE